LSSNIYIVSYPLHNRLKIGKADNVRQRINSIGREVNGLPCERASVYFSVPKESVFLFEKTLHKMFTVYNLNLKGFDGATEMFDLACLPQVIQHCKLLSDLVNFDLRLLPVFPVRSGKVAKVKTKEQNANDYQNRRRLYLTKYTVLNYLMDKMGDCLETSYTLSELLELTLKSNGKAVRICDVERGIVELVQDGVLSITKDNICTLLMPELFNHN
jgi:hypothetical protein